jgi:hypothetical protein
VKIRFDSKYNLSKYLIGALIIVCAGVILTTGDRSLASEHQVSQTKEASEALLSWLKHRVDLMVKTKASCEQMAIALSNDQIKNKDKIKRWRALKAGQTLAQRATIDLEFGRALNQLILKGDLVHSYCAYQSRFRDRLKSLLDRAD